MKLFEIQEDYFKELCREVFKDGQTFDDSDIYDEYIDTLSYGLDCSTDELRIIYNSGYETDIDFVDTHKDFIKFHKFVMKKKISKKQIGYKQERNIDIHFYELEEIKFAKVVSHSNHPMGEGDWSAWAICEDSLK